VCLRVARVVMVAAMAALGIPAWRATPADCAITLRNA
jgi:hypothetical protein